MPPASNLLRHAQHARGHLPHPFLLFREHALRGGIDRQLGRNRDQFAALLYDPPSGIDFEIESAQVAPVLARLRDDRLIDHQRRIELDMIVRADDQIDLPSASSS